VVVSGVASMYPASDWSICSGPSWTGLDRAIWVTSVRTRSEDRTSISSHPLADLGWKLLIGLRHRLLLISRSSFVRAKGRSFVPARRAPIAPRLPRSRRSLATPEPAASQARRPALTAPARREDQAGRTLASSVLVRSKARPLASTAQAMRASLLASAIASTLWCSRRLAASIQDLSPWRSQLFGLISTTHAACTNRTRK